MKALLLLMTLAVAMPVMAVTTVNEVAGPRVVGNGGGGVRENGVYKTFYSAGLYIHPQMETEIPGSELLSNVILDLAGDDTIATKLLSTALPMGERKFYKVLESKMDDKVMDRLLAEYARIVDQPADNLTIFAITDVGTQSTYLLPSFYKLSEIEQAAILFHEAYWILNPKADYAEVVSAEMEFQKFLELKDAGKYDMGFPKLLGRLMNDPTIPLKAAFRVDALSGKAASLISKDGKMKVNDLFLGTRNCEYADRDIAGKGSLMNKYRAVSRVKCTLGPSDLPLVMSAFKKYPESYFIKALANYLSQQNRIIFKTLDWYNESDFWKNVDTYMNKVISVSTFQYYERTKSIFLEL